MDVRFHTSAVDDQAPYVTIHSPATGALGVAVESNVTATFNESVDPLSVVFELRDAGNSLVATNFSYDGPSRTAILDPVVDLDHSAQYTATLSDATDLAANSLTAPVSWSFTTEDVPPPPPDEGPGGPILVIGEAGNPFTRYPAEILRTEGFNAFTVTDISLVDASVLTNYDVVILGEMALSAGQVTMFSDWVTAGGNLIALRPDKQLASLLGLSDAASTLAEGYLLVDTASSPGAGIVGETIQYHSSADLYDLAGATAVATLYSDATTATTHPAVTLVSVGSNGGQAAAFTYDLARSVVYTRQGNPAWAGQERDGTTPIRSDDLFFGDAAGDPQPDWIDLNKVAIPQADEQQRLLANLILSMNSDREPLPRFWYFPRGLRAVVVMTGDDHGPGSNSVGRFDIYKSSDPVGCSVADWECVRASTYLYPGTGGMTDAQAVYYQSLGFEIGVHVTTSCGDWTESSLASDYTTQLGDFYTLFPSMPTPDSERTHCIAWSEWATQPKIELANGIRLDTNYYYWPGSWLQDRPGMFTGSGMPMRFADLDGTMIDVYQAVTQMTDESDQSFPYTIDTLLDHAQGPEGYFGAFTANMHNDSVTHASASAIVASAQARGVPVISGRQMLTWLDARNGSSFSNLVWSSNTLSFDVARSASALNLEGMLPVQVGAATLQSLTGGLGSVWDRTETIKGVQYAIFPAESGSYVATYEVDTTPPVISNVNAAPAIDGTAVISWDTDEAATSVVNYGTDAGNLNLSVSDPALVSSHGLTLTSLASATTYYYRVSSADAGALVSTEPPTGNSPLSFLTPVGPCLSDATVADFAAGTPDAAIHISQVSDGELTLAPTEVAEFDGSSVPTGWNSGLWDPSGGATVAGGLLSLDAAYAGTDAVYGPDRAVEFVGTFQNVGGQHCGFGITFNEANWAIFSTGLTGEPSLRAWQTAAPSSIRPGFLHSGERPSLSHRMGGLGSADFIDGALVHTEPIALSTSMRPLASDLNLGGPDLVIDWMRMTPYVSAGSFTSRVYDAGTAANWGVINWNSDSPPNTSVAMAVRIGNTATPDGTWSPFGVIANPGDLVGGTAATSSTASIWLPVILVTPAVEDVAVDCAPGPDVDPPVILNVVATPSVDGTAATVTWTTLEAADSRVDFDTASSPLTQQQSDERWCSTTPSIFLGLTPGQTYYFRVSLADAASNSATEPILANPPLSFTTPAPSCAMVSTSSEFGAGTADAGVTVAEIGDGALILTPAEGSDFSGTALPSGWQSTPWVAGGGGVVSGGALLVDGSLVGTDAVYSAGRVLEFRATFGPEAFQHVGFAVDFDTVNSWAMFSTSNQTTDLYARTSPGGADINLGSGFVGSSHLYRIEWNASSVLFSIDGALVNTQNVSIATDMRPVASDVHYNDGNLITIDWLRMTPYASSGTWESEIHDTGQLNSTWHTLSWTQDVPAGSSLVVSARGGDTPTPDGSWTSYTPVASSGTDLALNAQYLQLRVQLFSLDGTVTPVFEDYSVTCTGCLDNTPPDALTDLAASQVNRAIRRVSSPRSPRVGAEANPVRRWRCSARASATIPTTTTDPRRASRPRHRLIRPRRSARAGVRSTKAPTSSSPSCLRRAISGTTSPSSPTPATMSRPFRT